VPDVSTTPRQSNSLLLKASSIAYTDPKLGGTTVLHLMKLADRFGINRRGGSRKGVLGDWRRRRPPRKVAHGQAEIRSLG